MLDRYMQVIISTIHPCLPVRKYWGAGPTGETKLTPPHTMEGLCFLFLSKGEILTASRSPF